MCKRKFVSKLEEYIKLIGASEEDALAALLSSFGVSQPNATVQYWKNHDAYGRTSPTTQEIISIYVNNDYRCQECGSQRRLSVDHIDGNAKNHSLDNLQLLCMSCNRSKSKKGTKDKDHKLLIYNATIELCHELGRFPSYNEIIDRAQVGQIGGVKYFVDFIRHRYENT